jgi:serine/threonine protein phosphatase PrpC
MLDLEFAQISDPGLVREHNEDYLGHVLPQTPDEARRRGWLFALADGVGGQDRGEVASTTAIEAIVSGFRKASSGEPLNALLSRLVQTANTRVFETGLSTGPGGSSMATTIVTCALRFDRAIVAHVGDSRCYLVRAGNAVSLTRDHTVSNEQLRLGLITARESAEVNTAHLLSRALGTEMFISVETNEHHLYAGDLLVLCSDGLHNSISTTDIVQIAGNASDLNAAARSLVALANQRDGSDNISLQIIRIRDVERVGMYRGRHYKLQ